MTTISLCMIVKNESTNIRRCLDSAIPYVDEIVIVDTGSADDTKAICSEYQAKILDFPWSDDFSAARNFGLEQASCEWILWLDADEELQIIDFSGLKSHLQTTKADLLPIRLLNFYGQGAADEKQAYTSAAMRLFRNKIGIYFKGRIHEQPDISSAKTPEDNSVEKFLRILHYGYMDMARQNKTGRNLSLLLREKTQQPDNFWLDYDLAAEYYGLEDYEKAFATVNQAIAGFLDQGKMPPALAYKLKYDILIKTQSFGSVLGGIDKAIALYPQYVDLHFYKGFAQLSFEEYEKAEQTFGHCLILGEDNPQYLILVGTGSFLALYYLGLCYEKQDKYAQALESYRQALAYYPDYAPARQRFYRLQNSPDCR